MSLAITRLKCDKRLAYYQDEQFREVSVNNRWMIIPVRIWRKLFFVSWAELNENPTSFGKTWYTENILIKIATGKHWSHVWSALHGSDVFRRKTRQNVSNSHDSHNYHLETIAKPCSLIKISNRFTFSFCLSFPNCFHEVQSVRFASRLTCFAAAQFKSCL